MRALDAPLETALRRDRLVVVGALGLVALLAWGWLLAGAGMDMGMGATGMGATGMPAMEGMAAGGKPASPTWSAGYVALMFFMWWIMMLAMMLPSATPMILLFAAVNRKHRERGGPFVPTAAFAAGYLVLWAVFSVLAVALQWGLQRVELVSPVLLRADIVVGGLLLVAAGLYQLTPLKHACLEHCRSPAHFLSRHWRSGPAGALRMGMEHGAFCVGCCWFLMLLLFVGGVMNLAWIAGLAAFVLLEKTVPAGHWLARAAGVALS
ncbi:MAG TPA: DUF2182 domain-containing protein [Geminicoccaceae bacterium]|nr:DUF2182 domain-containing protein [Geminicoccaceae bacterium]